MSGSLIIHYQPGARGDFLAGSLYDALTESTFGAISRPRGIPYKSVHVVDNYNFLNEDGAVSIRISSGIIDENNNWNGNSISPSLQIAHNWFTKHPHTFSRNPHYITMDLVEQYYHCVHFFCLYDMQALPYRHKYTHWIDFANIDNIDFVNNLRLTIRGTELPDQTKESMQRNIDKQPIWQNSNRADVIEQIRQLIDKELEEGIFLGPTWDHVPVQDKLALLKE